MRGPTPTGKRPKPRVRPADRGDTRFVAWVIQEAARSHLEKGFWDVALTDEARRIDFLEALARSDARSFCHYRGFLIAEVDGRPAAALSGYEPRIGLGSNWEEANAQASRELGFSGADRRNMATAMASLGSPFPEIPLDRWVIEWVATVPEFRGRGLIGTLLAKILQRGRDAGYDKAQVGYLIGNTPAMRAYEAVGFKTVDEKLDSDFEAVLGCPGIATMHADL